jgi:hypothetical protein
VPLKNSSLFCLLFMRVHITKKSFELLTGHANGLITTSLKEVQILQAESDYSDCHTQPWSALLFEGNQYGPFAQLGIGFACHKLSCRSMQRQGSGPLES